MDKINNCQLANADDGTFTVLGFISLQLPGPYLWHCQDHEEETSRGSIFRAYLPTEIREHDIASITVVDASNDSSEPDISKINSTNVPEVDEYLLKETKLQMVAQGRELIHWMSSQLNETVVHRGLVTAYIESDQGTERQTIALRLSVNTRKIVIVGVFDIERKDEVAKVVFGIMRNISFTSEQPN